MGITVEQLLAQIKDNRICCVAGFKGLSNSISGFTIIDTPDITQWLKGGEFVASLGYITSLNPDMRKNLIQDLVANGCAGLGIKKDVYYHETPYEYIVQGNLLDFPVIELPYQMRFSEVAHHIHSNIFTQNMSIAEQTYQIFENIISLVLTDAGVEHILYEISKVVHNPVILTNKDFEIIAYEIPAHISCGEMNVFNLHPHAKALSKKDVRSITSYFKESRFNSYKASIEGDIAKTDIIYIPIVAKRELLGFMLIPEIDKSLYKKNYKVLENITSTISIYLLKNKFIPQINAANSTFLHCVLINDQNSIESIRHYCQIFNFEYIKKRICLDIYLEHLSSMAYEKRMSVINIINQSIQNIYKKFGLDYYPVRYDNHFIQFIYFSNNEANEYAINTVNELAAGLIQFLHNNNVYVHIGISSFDNTLLHIPLAFKQAVEIISIGKRINPSSHIHSFENLKVYYFLNSTLSESELQNLASAIANIETFDESNYIVYIDTIECFIKNKFNISKAASELYIHRNSMAYRLSRISDILSIDWENPEDILKVQLGLHALKLLNTQK